MFIILEKKAIFIAVPKTATRAVYGMMGRHYNGKLLSEHARVIPKTHIDWYSFIITRNPYDRICSAYWHSCKRSIRQGLIGTKWYDRHGFVKYFDKVGLTNTFENYITIVNDRKHQAITTYPQIRWHNENRIDQIIRFEHLQEDFNTLPFLTEPIILPKINATSIYVKHKNEDVRPSWEEMVDKTTGPIINEIYAKDFKRLGYEMKDFS